LVGHHKVALAAFGRIANDAKGRQPIYDWARLHEGLAALVARDKTQARKSFQEVENAGEKNFAKEEVDLARFLVATARIMIAPGAVPADAATNIRGDTAEPLAVFLFALKDIDRLDVTHAIGLLERFVGTKPAGKFVWIGDFKPLAQKYFDDAQMYSAWKAQSQTTDAAAKVAGLREVKKKLKTRSAISDAVGAEERSMAASGERNPKGEDADLAASSKKKTEWLAAWKKRLVDDINRSHFSGPIADLSGTKYEGVSSATPEQLSLKTPYGIVSVPWGKVAPKTLLDVSTSYIKPNQPDTADRQWLSAVFASEVGEMETARTLAEAAAKAKPEYKVSVLIPPE
jgi:hypothetical protein